MAMTMVAKLPRDLSNFSFLAATEPSPLWVDWKLRSRCCLGTDPSQPPFPPGRDPCWPLGPATTPRCQQNPCRTYSYCSPSNPCPASSHLHLFLHFCSLYHLRGISWGRTAGCFKRQVLPRGQCPRLTIESDVAYRPCYTYPPSQLWPYVWEDDLVHSGWEAVWDDKAFQEDEWRTTQPKSPVC